MGIMRIKRITGSPFDIQHVLRKLPLIDIPCKINSFGDTESGGAFVITFEDNNLSTERFTKIMEILHKLPNDNLTEHLYVRVENKTSRIIRSVKLCAGQNVDYSDCL